MRSAARQRPLGDAREDRSPLRSFVSAAPDTLLVSSVLTLVAIGMIMIYSASSAQAYSDYHDPAYYFKRQLMWLVVGTIAAFFAYRMDYHVLRKAAPYLLLASLIGVAAVLVPVARRHLSSSTALVAGSARPSSRSSRPSSQSSARWSIWPPC